MSFVKFRDLVKARFDEICGGDVFVADIDKDEIWNLYLNSFPPGTNKIYRERTEHDCTECRHFIKRVGGVVGIKDGQVVSIWDVETNSSTYQPVVDALSAYVKSKPIINFFLSDMDKIGCEINYEIGGDGKSIGYDHFYAKVPSRFVEKNSVIRNRAIADKRDTRNVFFRTLSEISLESIDVVLELIASNSLYRGSEWKANLEKLRGHKVTFDALEDDKAKELYAWCVSRDVGVVVGRIKNHSIGVLLMDISTGEDLDRAVSKYEAIVAPSNYKRPKAIFTKRMLEDAQKTIVEMGYMESLGRRFARIDDITVNDILFANRSLTNNALVKGDVFAEMMKDVFNTPKKLGKVEEIDADTFVKNILPTANEVDVLFENRHRQNIVSLIAPTNKDSKTMFKWENNFSWAYKGNMADSMKERVKKHGGKVDGVLRFSIQWNDVDGTDDSDLDAHCRTPHTTIYYGNKLCSSTRGGLDVDITHPNRNIAVENITWADKSRMTPGDYSFSVNPFSIRNNQHGFRAEIEFDGEIHSFDYPHPIRQVVNVATVKLSNDGTFSIVEHLKSDAKISVCGVKTNDFVPVSVICYSPNYWDSSSGVGNKHLMFMLHGFKNDENPNGFFNEFLKDDLMKHKRVFEALGNKMKVEDDDEQLSGLGFCLTQRNSVTVRVKGATNRVFVVKF